MKVCPKCGTYMQIGPGTSGWYCPNGCDRIDRINIYHIPIAGDHTEPSKEPLPCPFCGGSPKLESDPHRYEFGRDRFRIVCSSCYSGTRWYDSPSEAWLMWSGRVKE